MDRLKSKTARRNASLAIGSLIALFAFVAIALPLLLQLPPDHHEFTDVAQIGISIDDVIQRFGQPDEQSVDDMGQRTAIYETSYDWDIFREPKVCTLMLDNIGRIIEIDVARKPSER